MSDEGRVDDWERHRREQIRDVMRGTTPAQRLAWLEEMIDLVRRAGARPLEDRQREAADKNTS